MQSENYDTVAGFVIERLGRLAEVGDTLQVDGLSVEVVSVKGTRISQVRVSRVLPASGQS